MKVTQNKIKALYYLVLTMLQISGLFGQSVVDFVNPFIGTGDHYGATHPGAMAPRGMVSIVPFNNAGGHGNLVDKDSVFHWTSFPYYFDNCYFTGYSHVNLSGVGCQDLGVIILMPTTGDIGCDYTKYGSSYTNESARAGYYSNYLTRYNIKTEVTASERAGVHRYSFPAGQANILLNLGLGLTNESGGMLRIVSDDEIEGFRTVGAFCYNNPEGIYPVYFVIRFSKKADKTTAWKKPHKFEGSESIHMPYNGKRRILNEYRNFLVGDDIGAVFSYDLNQPSQIEIKIGISYVSIKNARRNLDVEINKKSFDEVYSETWKKWDKLLSRIEVEGGTYDQKAIFYTALYHTLIHPNIFNDVNGEYRMLNSGKINKTKSTRYTVFSLWDTYRGVNQLASLVYPEQQELMVRSMVDMYKESGWLPKWELNGTETFTMVGDPASIVITDTYIKGLQNFDVVTAYDAMKKSASDIGNPLRPGLQQYDSLGYVSTDCGIFGSVSTTLEYCIADYGVSVLARELGKNDDADYFAERSKNYINLFDPTYRVFRPKHSNGKWYEPFAPEAGAHFDRAEGFVEASALQYAFMVPHDIETLVNMHGGADIFAKDLNDVFYTGNFNMTNEPDIHYPYLFNYTKSKEWMTQKYVRELLEKHFYNSPSGLPGNDDTGTMSSWVVFSMMGLYPVNPVSDEYTVTTPTFDKVILHLNHHYYPGKKIIINKIINDPESRYIVKLYFNGKEYNSYFLKHSDLVRGGIFNVIIGSE